MTYQIRNALVYEDEKWRIEERFGDKLFIPEDFGLHVTGAASTACWNGYHCIYSVLNGVLFLTKLEINVDKRNAPLLNSQEPVRYEAPHFIEDMLVWDKTTKQIVFIDDSHPETNCDFIYSNVNLPLSFTGGLIVGKGRTNIPSSIGPELVWQYEHIRELIFDQGRLTETYDRSDAVAHVREEIAKNNGEIPMTKLTGKVRPIVHEQYEALEALINSCFKFDY